MVLAAGAQRPDMVDVQKAPLPTALAIGVAMSTLPLKFKVKAMPD